MTLRALFQTREMFCKLVEELPHMKESKVPNGIRNHSGEGPKKGLINKII